MWKTKMHIWQEPAVLSGTCCRRIYMKLTVGLGSIDQYIRFVKAGADEFFCGYVPYSWSEKYGTVLPLNRREVLSCQVQLGAFEELKILKKMKKEYDRQVHLTFNSLYYLPEQYQEIADIIVKCMKLGFQREKYSLRNSFKRRDRGGKSANGGSFSETESKKDYFSQKKQLRGYESRGGAGKSGRRKPGTDRI